jgi:hypothetical protein
MRPRVPTKPEIWLKTATFFKIQPADLLETNPQNIVHQQLKIKKSKPYKLGMPPAL